jgi:hypothetical protein
MSADTINFYQHIPAKYTGAGKRRYPNFQRIHIELPTRMAVVGPTGSGKTNIAMNFIFGCGAFTRIFLCVKTPDEPLYQWMIDQIREAEARLGKDILTVLSDPDDLPPVDSFDPKVNNLVLFDDVINDAQSKLKHIADLWVRGRKRNISTLFLAQSFYKIPKLVRDNSDILMLKAIANSSDLNRILAEKAMDMNRDQLLAMYNACDTRNVSNSFTIDNTPGQEPKWKYRRNFTPLLDE